MSTRKAQFGQPLIMLLTDHVQAYALHLFVINRKTQCVHVSEILDETIEQKQDNKMYYKVLGQYEDSFSVY